MRTKDEILVEISKIKHSIELGCSTTETAYRVGMVDGMYYAIGDDKTDQQNDDVVTLNVQYKLNKEAYRQYVADMNQIEAEFKADNRSRKFIAGEELEEGDLVYKHSDGKMYKSDCIPANLKDVCKWWIKKYKRDTPFDEYTSEGNIAEHMAYIMKKRGW
jgi:hypothetical protein